MGDVKLAKARKIRATLLNRIRGKLEHLRDNTPSSQDLKDWLDQWDGKCYYFKTNISLEKCHIDHKIPLSRGGSNELKNLCITHPRANNCKGALTDKEFKQLIKIWDKWDKEGRKDLMDRLVRSTAIFGRKK